jgi:hypothetical protein
VRGLVAREVDGEGVEALGRARGIDDRGAKKRLDPGVKSVAVGGGKQFHGRGS